METSSATSWVKRREHAMKQKGWTVRGIEPDAGAREQARKMYSLDLENTDILHQLEPQQYDAITLWHVLEHVHQLHPYVEGLKSLLKPGGRIFIAVPNYEAADAGIYKPFWAAYDVPRHLYHFTPRSMETLMKIHGLNLIEKKTHVVRQFLYQPAEQQIQKWKDQLAGGCYEWPAFQPGSPVQYQQV